MTISDDERHVLRDAALTSWRVANRDRSSALLARAMHAQTDAADTIARANRAIERALREIELSQARRATTTKPRVVVADGRIAERVLLAHALRVDSRVEVIGDAVNGAEALAICIVHQPDAIVLDDRLPLLAGLDVAADLRLHAPRTRAILLADDNDPVLLSRPPIVEAIAPRYGDRFSLVELVVRIAS